MKNSEIVAAYNSIMAIMEGNEKYPVKFSYALTRNLKMLEGLVKTFEEERKKLLNLYAEKGGESKEFKIAAEHQENWEKDLKDLLEIEVEFNPHMLSVDDLPENIEPAVFYSLDFMIKE